MQGTKGQEGNAPDMVVTSVHVQQLFAWLYL